jgi:hypothetical protein
MEVVALASSASEPPVISAAALNRFSVAPRVEVDTVQRQRVRGGSAIGSFVRAGLAARSGLARTQAL